MEVAPCYKLLTLLPLFALLTLLTMPSLLTLITLLKLLKQIRNKRAILCTGVKSGTDCRDY